MQLSTSTCHSEQHGDEESAFEGEEQKKQIPRSARNDRWGTLSYSRAEGP